ncbi:aromatic-ring-hydroxylating dioxygenase subunit beta [Variovorax paradoxus]|uniref:aromatic-ring-hydroxylating dioxygenase subunit beta n=1 Tax=Variovorax paradoxus TaxID=34073 RepID=UPI001ABC35C0
MKSNTAAASVREESAAVSPEEYHAVSQFLFREARLADESRYHEWEALVDDDMLYWVPRGEGDYDMTQHLSITADNRSRLRTRIAQLNTGERHAQTPPSKMRRVISNIEVHRFQGGDEYQVYSNFVLYELRMSSTRTLETWPGRIEHRLRWKNRELTMFYKKVMLVHGDEALPSLAFII